MSIEENINMISKAMKKKRAIKNFAKYMQQIHNKNSEPDIWGDDAASPVPYLDPLKFNHLAREHKKCVDFF